MTDSERIEAVIQAVSGQTEVLVQLRTMLAELAAWLQQPPSKELPDLLRHLIVAFEGLSDSVQGNTMSLVALRREVQEVPAKVAGALSRA